MVDVGGSKMAVLSLNEPSPFGEQQYALNTSANRMIFDFDFIL
jgi:hypothetical protein